MRSWTYGGWEKAPEGRETLPPEEQPEMGAVSLSLVRKPAGELETIGTAAPHPTQTSAPEITESSVRLEGERLKQLERVDLAKHKRDLEVKAQEHKFRMESRLFSAAIFFVLLSTASGIALIAMGHPVEGAYLLGISTAGGGAAVNNGRNRKRHEAEGIEETADKSQRGRRRLRGGR
jgi:hypothetical protein